MPMQSTQPGASFMIARVGRFALMSVKVSGTGALPRRSATRALLSRPNDEIDPQTRLFEDAKARKKTELAYFGCLVSIPCKVDPTVPAELAIAVLSAATNRWLCWMSIPQACGGLMAVSTSPSRNRSPQTEAIPDRAFPKLRVPKLDSSEEN
jgi:hypothetical protein